MQTLFIESWCDDERIIEENVRRVKISSPDVSRLLLACAPSKNDLNLPVRWLVIRRCSEALLGQDICQNPSISNHGGERFELYQGMTGGKICQLQY